MRHRLFGETSGRVATIRDAFDFGLSMSSRALMPRPAQTVRDRIDLTVFDGRP